MTQLDNIPRKNPFKVPDNYFEDVDRRIIAETAGRETVSEKKVIHRKINPYLLAAASVAVLAVLVYLTADIFINRQKTYELSYSEILTDPYINDIELSVIEEHAATPDFSPGFQELKKSDIIDYLLLDNIDTEEIIEKL
jgi:hypothetical protein